MRRDNLCFPRAGQLLAGRCRLRQPVALGAAGAVRRAYDELLAREVAANIAPVPIAPATVTRAAVAFTTAGVAESTGS